MLILAKRSPTDLIFFISLFESMNLVPRFEWSSLFADYSVSFWIVNFWQKIARALRQAQDKLLAD
ncbi:hypothetical protein EGH73_04565 [Epilithonimonas hominis]|uniref:Uncharacterized protein n=1 Tax=Epilithonimonas hominis TaxID=420404 RepID=A0A3N0X9H1_9FLAO|nr:hypothetical protein EGH73_04565 [Epilithonimonas hominis]